MAEEKKITREEIIKAIEKADRMQGREAAQERISIARDAMRLEEREIASEQIGLALKALFGERKEEKGVVGDAGRVAEEQERRTGKLLAEAEDAKRVYMKGRNSALTAAILHAARYEEAKNRTQDAIEEVADVHMKRKAITQMLIYKTAMRHMEELDGKEGGKAPDSGK